MSQIESQEDKGRIEMTDYFVVKGARKLALRMMQQTMADLQLSPTTAANKKLIAEARAWVELEPEANDPVQGLSFEDCAYMIGHASSAKALRKAAIENPAVVQKAIAAALDAINASEAAYGDVAQVRRGEALTTDKLDSSWLFGGRPESVSMRSEARG